MKNFEELKELCVKKNDELIKQFIEYMNLSDEREDDAFKSWVIQKLSMNEVVLTNINEQSENIVNFLKDILDQLRANQKSINEIKNSLPIHSEYSKFSKAWTKLEPLCKKLTDNENGEIDRFLNEPRSEWADLTPIQMIQIDKEDAVETLLNRMIEGDPIS